MSSKAFEEYSLMPVESGADDETSCILLNFKDCLILFSLAAVRALSADPLKKLVLKGDHTLLVTNTQMKVDTRVAHIKKIVDGYCLDNLLQVRATEQVPPRSLDRTNFIKHYKLLMCFEEGPQVIDFIGLKLYEFKNKQLCSAFSLLQIVAQA
jgi:hypothetical protein